MLNLLLGRGKVDIYGTVDRQSPLVVLQWRNKWWDWRYYYLDTISFLLIVERLCEWTGKGDFIYDQYHDEVHYRVVIPEWAVLGMQRKAAVTGPHVYEMLKKSEEMAVGIMDKMEPEQKERLGEIYLPLQKYKKIHAKLNGYQYDTQRSEVLH